MNLPPTLEDSFTFHEVANRARILRSQLKTRFGREFTCLLIEGRTDSPCFGFFIDEENCYTVVARGKSHAICALIYLQTDGFNGCVSIVDADFDYLEGVQITNNSLFYTDTHDLETMIIKSPALKKLILEYVPPQYHYSLSDIATEVRDTALEIGKTLGYIRWANEKQRLNLHMKNIDFTAIIDPGTLKIRVPALEDCICDAGRSLDVDGILDSMGDVSHDPWHICRGHDLTRIIKIVLPLILRKKCQIDDGHPVIKYLENLPFKEIEKQLRLSYEFAFFQSTQLWSSVSLWEAQNKPFVVFRQ